MKNLRKGRTLGRTSDQKKALLCGLTASLIINKRIKTTLAKAKEMKSFAEKIITKSKVNKPHNIRLVKKYLTKEPTKELFSIVGPHFVNRNGGYTRIYKLGQRDSDATPMAYIELVDLYKDKENKGDKKEGKRKKETKNKKDKRISSKSVKKKKSNKDIKSNKKSDSKKESSEKKK